MRAILAAMWLVHWLPLPVLGRMGNALGDLVYLVVRSRRHITLVNLRLCFPQWSELDCQRVARDHFRAYMRSMLERGVLWWASEERLRRLITVEPCLPLQAIKAGPTILLCPHFVNLDVAGVAVAMTTSGCSVYSRQSNSVMDRALRKGRSRFNPVALFCRSQGIKPVLRAMGYGMPFFMCPDMDFGAQGAAFVPFFGVVAATQTAPARLAALTGATVIPVVATVLPGFKGWKVSFGDPWLNYPGSDMTQATRRMNQFIEEEVVKAPAEYLWAHRRFKTRPSGHAGVYAKAGRGALVKAPAPA